MAMFAPIPLPGIDNPQFKDVMDYFETIQNRKMKQQQFQQDLALRKQAEQRAQTLMPYMIQQYKDLHGKEMAEADVKKMYSGLLHDALNSSNQTPSSTDIGASEQTLPGAISQNIEQPQLPISPMLAPENKPIQQPPINVGGAPMPAQTQQSQIAPNLAPKQEPEIPQGTAPAMTPDSYGQEITVKPGNPSLSKLDKVAGLIPGIPKPETHFAPNGMIITRYPSGRVTVQHTAMPGMKTVSQETPEERQKREIDTRISSASGIEDAKAASKLETSGRELKGLVDRAVKIKKLLQENPNLTGILKGGLATLNLSESKKLAEFDQTTRKLQADIARYGSQRGGAQALKWGERSKPGIYKKPSYNLGMVQSILDDAKTDYEEMAAEYKSRTGKEYPIKFPDIGEPENSGSKDRVTIIDSNGDEHTILRINLDKARQRDKGVRLKGKS